MLPLSFSASDSSSQAVNPFAGLLSGGFTFGTQKQYGGSGNSQDNTAKPTATLSPQISNGLPTGGGVTPFADGLLGFGGGSAASSGSASMSLLLPAALLGGAILIAVALRK